MNIDFEKQLQTLAAETDRVKQEQFFKDYLKAAAQFWQYSWRNQWLISVQLPTATRVAGLRAWNKLGRHVQKGAQALRILAPMVQMDSNDDEVVHGFRTVAVFDVSQTEGKELPDLKTELTGDSSAPVLAALEQLCAIRGIRLEFAQLRDGLYGFSAGGRIVVDNACSVNTQVSTLVHEIAHELLHRKTQLDLREREIEAEGVAYVVMSALGYQPQSFNYLALYKADAKSIMARLSTISGTAKEVLTFVQTALTSDAPLVRVEESVEVAA